MEFPPPSPFEDAPDPTVLVGGAPPSAAKRRRGPILALSAFAAVLALGGTAFAVQRWLGTTNQDAASSIPADMDFYIGIDAVRLLAEDTTEVFDTLARVFDDTGGSDDYLTELDRSLFEETGFDFTNDIRPWVGRTAAVGFNIPGFTADTVYAAELTPEAIFAVESRDDAAAAAFLDKLSQALSEDGLTMTETVLDGVSVFEGSDVAFAIDDSVVLIGTPSLLRRALALDPTESLSASAEFSALTGELPQDRFLTGYVQPGAFDSLSTGLTGSAVNPAGGVLGMAFSAGVRPEGLAFEYVARLDAQGTALAQEMLAGSQQFFDALPAGTVAFAQFGSVASYWKQLGQSIEGLGMDLESQIESFNAEIGLDIVNDVINRLDQPSGIAMYRSTVGGLAVGTGYPVGLLAAFGTSTPELLTGPLDTLAAYAEASGSAVRRSGSLYVFGDGPDDFAAAGVVGSWLAIGTDAGELETFGTGQGDFAADPTYTEARQLIASETVSFYANVGGIMAMFDLPADQSASWAPIKAVIGGGSINGDLQRVTAAILVDH